MQKINLPLSKDAEKLKDAENKFASF